MLACLALCLPALCDAYYISLNQNEAPFLKQWDGMIVDWSVGRVAALTDTSRAVRLNSRGIHFYNHPVYPRGSTVWDSALGEPCKRSSESLCVLGSGSLVFPETSAPRFSVGERRCGPESSGRVLVADSSLYDISACDLYVRHLDVIYADGTLYMDQNVNLSDMHYYVVAVVVLYLVVSLGQNIARTMGDEDAATYPLVTELVCCFLLVFLLLTAPMLKVFVSEHDITLFAYSLLYILVYLARHGYELGLISEKQVFTFNVIVVTLKFATARLYCSFETPYASVFLVFLMSRFFHKLFRERTDVENFILTMDSLMIGFLYKMSFASSFISSELATCYIVGLFAMTFFIGKITTSEQIVVKALPQK